MSGQNQVSGDSVTELNESSVPDPTAPESHWGYREILLLIAIGILAEILVTSGAARIAQVAVGLEASDFVDLVMREPRVAVPMQIATWLAALAFIAYVVRIRCGKPLLAGVAWIRLPRSPTTYLRTGGLLAFGSVVASIGIGELDAPSPMQQMFSNPDGLWILAVYGIVLAPCIEEIVFRGFFFAPLERHHGQWAALLITSAVFAALHGSQYDWHWQRLLVLLAVGAAFGIVRIRSGSVKASALVHATYNSLLFLVVLSIPGGLG